MRNKIKNLVFLILLFFPFFVFAAGDVTVSTTSITVAQGETQNFNIVASNAAGKVTISSNNIDVASVSKSSEWIENSTLSVVVTGNKAGTSIITVTVDAATFNEEVLKKTYTITVTVTPPKSTNNKLGSLSLSTGTLSPMFNADTTNYTAIVNASSVTINASKGDNGQTVTGTGSKNLNYGKNTFNIVVKSAAGTTRTYSIVITRQDTRNTNNFLNKLSLDVGTINFKKETTNYSLKVAPDVSSMKVSATLDDSKATFVKKYGPRTVNLEYGLNSVLVKVEAENGSVKTYTIKVEREDNRSTNNNLKSIVLSSGDIVFSKEVTTYSTTVPYGISQLEVTALAEDDKSEVVVSSPDLVIGDNIVTVTVTSENGKSKVYTINVKRLDESTVLSENNNVSSINIMGHGIDFDPDDDEYEVNIGDEYALVIEVLLEDPSAKYVIEGNENLKDGSVIKIISTSESGIAKEYKININKDLKASTSGSASGLLSGIIGFVLGLVVMFIAMFIFNKVKNDQGKSKIVVTNEVKKVVNDKNSINVIAEPAEPSLLISDQEVISVAPAPVIQDSVVSVESTKVVEPVKTEQVAPVSKPVMQEADVKQPYLQELNQISENKLE